MHHLKTLDYESNKQRTKNYGINQAEEYEEEYNREHDKKESLKTEAAFRSIVLRSLIFESPHAFTYEQNSNASCDKSSC